jgi:polysaccharide pyruvyl transferase WcaK-like protein
MQKTALLGHGGSGNHGCEAIVRGLVQWAGLKKDDLLLSKNLEEDKRYGLDDLLTVLEVADTFKSDILHKFKAVLSGNTDSYHYHKLYRNLSDKINGYDIALSIGGDNYCYPGMALEMSIMRQMAAKAGAKTILTGCSVDLNLLKKSEVDDIRLYDRIICRESFTYKSLLEAGFNNLEFAPDPAFCLNPTSNVLPAGFKEGNTVGINISPIVIQKGISQSTVMRNYMAVIRYILQNTSMNIALIPHVVWGSNDDRRPLGWLYGHCPEHDRIVMLDDCDASTLKGYISRCRFMIAARTHASIAAYSTGVPTLVIGYSIKSQGIARDLFGTDKGYVLPVSEMKQVTDLTDAFIWLMNNEDIIKKRYECYLPDYLGGLKNSLL